MTTNFVEKEQNSAGAMRKCIATAELCPKSQLTRFVVGPDETLVFDAMGKLPGRGIWVKSDRGAIELAAKKGLFARSAKIPVKVPDNLASYVEKAVCDRVVSLLALARKSGNAITGSTKVKEWANAERAVVLLQASDGSTREKSRIRLWGDGKSFECLTKEELGRAFGRDFAVHAALDAGGLAARVIEEATRLEGLRAPSAEKHMKG
ncbi:RNA-binding protein [Lentibacter algarum]|uniref:RNA-binding protein n=1 Tax=Lentibacter algarum TaxID=576131 RepID=UPI001C069475|nr:RNA-binding protein [Lentibacter algarum]MBU2981071.1 RNA-binding protein [Lentibacter algarum]